MDFWVTLWTLLLWGSAGAFALVTLYILSGALARLFRGTGE